jgi:hypothetical protein
VPAIPQWHLGAIVPAGFAPSAIDEMKPITAAGKDIRTRIDWVVQDLDTSAIGRRSSGDLSDIAERLHQPSGGRQKD